MMCVRCKKREVDTLYRYDGIDFNIEPPEVKMCQDCRVEVFPDGYVPSEQYAKFVIMYGDKLEKFNA